MLNFSSLINPLFFQVDILNNPDSRFAFDSYEADQEGPGGDFSSN